MKSLPSGPWEVLFQRALRLVDDIQRHGGLADPFWTFGGGTVLMFRYGHRLSKDIDIFVPDPQYLGYVTPRPLRIVDAGHHRQCIGDDVGGHARLDRPADDLSVEQVHHDSQVQAGLARVDVGDIAPSHAVGRFGPEVARQQVRRHWHRMPGIRIRLEAPLVACPDAVLTHQPLDPAQADAVPPVVKLSMHAVRSVGGADLGMHALHQGHSLRVAQARAVRLAAASTRASR